MMYISQIKPGCTFGHKVDKLDHLLNRSTLELPSQGWAREDAMSRLY